MPKRDEREYRSVPLFEARKAGEGEEPSFFVEGYAATFDKFLLYEDYDGYKTYEQIDRHAFDETDFSDCCFLKDHEGTVFARTKNGTIELTIDEHGLFTRTDLSKTDSAKAMYQEIDAGMYDQMSYSFIVSDSDWDYDYENKIITRTIKKIPKVYDVSAVWIPANPNTDISVATRSAFDGFIEAREAERLQEERRSRTLQLEKEKLLLRLSL